VSGHTPGPWRWEVSLKSKNVSLCGGRPPFDQTVMDFVRWGMGGAAPRFVDRDRFLLRRADEFSVSVPGREHHSGWFRAIDHPDARLIEAAPDLLAALKDAIEMLEFVCECHEGPVTPEQEADWARLNRARAAIAKAEGK
jgi:hypothetical protein